MVQWKDAGAWPLQETKVNNIEWNSMITKIVMEQQPRQKTLTRAQRKRTGEIKYMLRKIVRPPQ